MTGQSSFQKGFSQEVPLAVGSVRGFRSFEYITDLKGQQGYRWEPGENVARCLIPEWNDNELDPCSGVTPDCTCGFYAYWGDKGMDDTFGNTVAVIEGYGLTVIGSYGFRCGKAKILALAPRDPAEPAQKIVRQSGYSHVEYGHETWWEAFEPELRGVFPDVALFQDVDTMLKEFPPDDPPEHLQEPKPAEGPHLLWVPAQTHSRIVTLSGGGTVFAIAPISAAPEPALPEPLWPKLTVTIGLPAAVVAFAAGLWPLGAASLVVCLALFIVAVVRYPL